MMSSRLSSRLVASRNRLCLPIVAARRLHSSHPQGSTAPKRHVEPNHIVKARQDGLTTTATTTTTMTTARYFASSSSSSSPSSKPDTSDPPTVANVVLASLLFGFVAFVFSYSMNAVGRSDGEEDPLAQLKAEAQEARDSTGNPTLTQRKMTPEEIMALESGMGAKGENIGDMGQFEVAVAAPADIAALEEEANMKVFRQRQGGGAVSSPAEPKKKPWWRFGF